MFTITIWVLLSLGSFNSQAPTVVVARFATSEDCSAALRKVRQSAPSSGKGDMPIVECVEMHVLRDSAN